MRLIKNTRAYTSANYAFTQAREHYLAIDKFQSKATGVAAQHALLIALSTFERGTSNTLAQIIGAINACYHADRLFQAQKADRLTQHERQLHAYLQCIATDLTSCLSDPE